MACWRQRNNQPYVKALVTPTSPGLGGLGRTLADGHHHEARWSAADRRRQLRLVRAEGQRVGTAPAVEALVPVNVEPPFRYAMVGPAFPGTLLPPLAEIAAPFYAGLGRPGRVVRRGSGDGGEVEDLG